MRYRNDIVAAFKMVDTCAAEFESETPYYYSCFGSENEVERDEMRKKVLVLAPARSVSVRESSLTIVRCTVCGR